MYTVQFISSGIVAFKSPDRGFCKEFIRANNYGPDKPIYSDTSGSEGEIVGYEQGDCLNLFKLVKEPKHVHA